MFRKLILCDMGIPLEILLTIIHPNTITKLTMATKLEAHLATETKRLLAGELRIEVMATDINAAFEKQFGRPLG